MRFGIWRSRARGVLRSTDLAYLADETPLAAAQSSGIYSVAFRDPLHGVIVGGDYAKEAEAVDNAAVTSDGGQTWSLVKGLRGFRSVVAYVPGSKSSFIAIGPRGGDLSKDDGHSWSELPDPGFDTFSFVRENRGGEAVPAEPRAARRSDSLETRPGQREERLASEENHEFTDPIAVPTESALAAARRARCRRCATSS